MDAMTVFVEFFLKILVINIKKLKKHEKKNKSEVSMYIYICFKCVITRKPPLLTWTLSEIFTVEVTTCFTLYRNRDTFL